MKIPDPPDAASPTAPDDSEALERLLAELGAGVVLDISQERQLDLAFLMVATPLAAVLYLLLLFKVVEIPAEYAESVFAAASEHAGLGPFLGYVIGLTIVLPALAVAVGLLHPLALLRRIRSGIRFPAEPLRRDQEDLLYRFFDRVAQRTGGPPPVRIAVDMGCDVTVRRTVSTGPALTLGLPLVAGLTLEQLVGLAAHRWSVHLPHSGRLTLKLGNALALAVRRILPPISELASSPPPADLCLGKLFRERGISEALFYGLRFPRLLLRLAVALTRRPWGSLARELDREAAYLVDPRISEAIRDELAALRDAHVEVLGRLDELRAAGELPETVPALVVATRRRRSAGAPTEDASGKMPATVLLRDFEELARRHSSADWIARWRRKGLVTHSLEAWVRRFREIFAPRPGGDEAVAPVLPVLVAALLIALTLWRAGGREVLFLGLLLAALPSVAATFFDRVRAAFSGEETPFSLARLLARRKPEEAAILFGLLLFAAAPHALLLGLSPFVTTAGPHPERGVFVLSVLAGVHLCLLLLWLLAAGASGVGRRVSLIWRLDLHAAALVACFAPPWRLWLGIATAVACAVFVVEVGSGWWKLISGVVAICFFLSTASPLGKLLRHHSVRLHRIYGHDVLVREATAP